MPRLVMTLCAAVAMLALPATATAASGPTGIAAGPDGAMWFTERGADRIGRIAPNGGIAEFALPADADPFAIAAGPDGALWFTQPLRDEIGRITTAGVVTEFTVTGAGSVPYDIVAGPDERLWFTQRGSDEIGAMTTAGTLTEYEITGSNDRPTGIASDGVRIYFTETGSAQIARMSTAGALEFEISASSGSAEPVGVGFNPADFLLHITERGANQVSRLGTAGGVLLQSPLPIPGSAPTAIAPGSDGAMWFVESGSGQIGREANGTITDEYPVPFGSAFDIASGPGAGAPLWFTIPSADRIGQIASDGEITTFALPGAPSVAGPQGPAGPPGPAGESRIGLVAFQALPGKPKAGKRVLVKFALTGPAQVSLEVAHLGKGSKAPKRVASQTAKAGVGTIAWNGKLNGKAAAPGRYKLTVNASAADSSASSSVTIRLVARRAS